MSRKFASVEAALSNVVTANLLPGPVLNQLAALHNLEHNGTFFDAPGSRGIVSVLQERFNPIDPERGIPYKRWQLPWRGLDAAYRPDVAAANNELLEQMAVLHDATAFTPSQKYYEHVLVHGNLLAQSFAIWKHFLGLWDDGVRFGKIFLLTDELVLQEGDLLPDLRRLCAECKPPFASEVRKRIAELPPFQTEKEMSEVIWERLYLPKHMNLVPRFLVCAPTLLAPDGKPVPAKTEDTLAALLQHDKFVKASGDVLPGDILVLSCAPYTLRQHVATLLALLKHLPGRVVETVAAGLAEPHSLTIFNREAANLAWKIREALSEGWRPLETR